jgi:hypothetical protein
MTCSSRRSLNSALQTINRHSHCSPQSTLPPIPWLQPAKNTANNMEAKVLHLNPSPTCLSACHLISYRRLRDTSCAFTLSFCTACSCLRKIFPDRLFGTSVMNSTSRTRL